MINQRKHRKCQPFRRVLGHIRRHLRNLLTSLRLNKARELSPRFTFCTEVKSKRKRHVAGRVASLLVPGLRCSSVAARCGELLASWAGVLFAQTNHVARDLDALEAITRLREGLIDSFTKGDIDRLLKYLDTNVVVTSFARPLPRLFPDPLPEKSTHNGRWWICAWAAAMKPLNSGWG